MKGVSTKVIGKGYLIHVSTNVLVWNRKQWQKNNTKGATVNFVPAGSLFHGKVKKNQERQSVSEDDKAKILVKLYITIVDRIRMRVKKSNVNVRHYVVRKKLWNEIVSTHHYIKNCIVPGQRNKSKLNKKP